MILYAKSLGATATVLGVIASLTPLLTIAQIPAARFLARTGYRRFIFAGWGSRTVIVFFMATVPLMTFLNDLAKISLLLFCLFVFNLLRGIASGAWLPWMTDLIPEEVRGRFLSRDQLFMNAGCLAALALSAIMLRGNAAPHQFAIIFLVSALGGLVSLAFLLRTPDIEGHEQLATSTARVPWREIVMYPPFLKLVIFTVLWVVTVGAVAVFNVAFMKTKLGFSESRILFFTTFYFLAALISLPLVGRLLDRTGSKIVLQGALAVTFFVHCGWWLVSASVVAPSLLLLCVLHFINGVAGASFNVAQVRLVMNTMPSTGRSHFFAFFTVITSLGLGFSPIAWGLIIDAIGEWQRATGPLLWNRY
ncbi:MAG: hypothetical protein QOD99_2293, partial [Chthoniobacter sp.]|nr:hypothetical protein [Chthoniobacter sp.]